jgi:hypothetical protein
MFYLKYGHPAEDAFILFRYSEILSETGVISFNYHGEPTEGATDFLWMVLLAILYKLGINIAIGAALLNSIGVFLVSYIVYDMLNTITDTKYSLKNNLMIFLLLLSFLVFSKVALASYLGFSVLAYTSLMLAVYYFAWKMQLNKWLFFSVVFILFRPEAVLLFSGSALYILVSSIKRKVNIPYKHFSFLLIVGIVYFIWRFQYFNELLPLPLYVKQIGSAEYYNNFKDLISIFRSLIMLGVSVLFIFIFKRNEFKISKIWVYAFIFLSIYLMIIITGHKSQNVYNRYEAPLFIFLFVSYLVIVRNYLSNIVVLSINFIFLFTSLYSTSKLFIYGTKMDDFTKTAISLQQDNSPLNIALTEAGNIPYWTKAKIFDLAGLNTRLTAKQPLTCSMLDNFSPDLIEVDLHNNTYISRSDFIKNENLKCGVTELSTLLKYSKYNFNNPVLTYKKGGLPTTHIALINTMFCFKNNDLYSNYNIFYTEKRDQVYIWDKKNKYAENIENALLDSCEINSIGYLDVILKRY